VTNTARAMACKHGGKVSTSELPRCTKCGYDYGDGEQPPCPTCGSTERTFPKYLTGQVGTMGSLGGVKRRPGYPRGWVIKFVERTKLSGLGKLARESLRIDRSDPNKTVKTHRVEEQQDDGSWQLEHDERKEYPAKRRPPDADAGS
jgi:hypothetical protein